MGELVRVKIKGIVSTSRYGTLESGDILRTDPDFAKHLVEECNAASYVDVVDAEAEEKAKAEAEEKAKAEAEEKAKAEAEAKAKAEAGNKK